MRKLISKKCRLLYSVILILFSYQAFSDEVSKITFLSNDDLEITADTYFLDENKGNPLIALFHQAGWSRGEYLEIAPKLNKMGFNCVAADLRSGKEINNIPNMTAENAIIADKQTRYIDALPDILATLRYIDTHFPNNKVIAWGSSYSAALVLHAAGEYPELIDGVLSFAPGEYFTKQGKSKTWVKNSSSKIKIPVFITSAKNEKNNWVAIFNSIESKQKTYFLPNTNGNHGSKALWKQFEDSDEYWKAVEQFLTHHFL
jgi:predicted esterase